MEKKKGTRREALTIASEVSQIIQVILPIIVAIGAFIWAVFSKDKKENMTIDIQWVGDALPYLKAVVWLSIGIGFYQLNHLRKKQREQEKELTEINRKSKAFQDITTLLIVHRGFEIYAKRLMVEPSMKPEILRDELKKERDNVKRVYRDSNRAIDDTIIDKDFDDYFGKEETNEPDRAKN